MKSESPFSSLLLLNSEMVSDAKSTRALLAKINALITKFDPDWPAQEKLFATRSDYGCNSNGLNRDQGRTAPREIADSVRESRADAFWRWMLGCGLCDSPSGATSGRTHRGLSGAS